MRTPRRVEVKTLLGGAFDLPVLDQLLQDEHLHWQDALIVTAACRPQLAEIPLEHWGSHISATGF